MHTIATTGPNIKMFAIVFLILYGILFLILLHKLGVLMTSSALFAGNPGFLESSWGLRPEGRALPSPDGAFRLGLVAWLDHP